MSAAVYVWSVLFLVITQTHATSVWVDSTLGSDTAAGTKDAPFLTIAKALTSITTADAYTGQSSTINLVSTNYTVGELTKYLYVTTNGLQLTITSTVRSTLITPGAFFGVYVSGNGTVTFDNISIYPNNGYSSSRVLYVWQSSVTLNNCYFGGFQIAIGSALYFDGGNSNVTIKNCTFDKVIPGIQSGSVVQISGITNTTWDAVIQDSKFIRSNNTATVLELYNTKVTITNSVVEDDQTAELISCTYSTIESHNTKIETNASPLLDCYYCVVHTDTSYGIAASGCTIDYNPGSSSGSSATGSSSTTDSSLAASFYPLVALIVSFIVATI